MSNQTRIKFFDIAKAIAFICIVLGHTGYELDARFMHFLFAFHVPLFFIVSGYFMNNKSGYRIQARKYAKGLLVPYLWGTLLIIAANAVIDLCAGVDIRSNIVKWISAALYGSGLRKDLNIWPLPMEIIGAIWFLPALFWSRIIVQMLLRVSEGDLKLSGLAVCALSFVGWYLSDNGEWLPFGLLAGLTSAVFVWAGFALKTHRVFEKTVPVPLLLLLLFVGVYAAWNTPLLLFVQNQFGGGMANVCSAVILSFLVLKLCQLLEKTGLKMRLLAYIGRDTLPLLALHTCEAKFIDWSIESTAGSIVNVPALLIDSGLQPNYWMVALIRLLFLFLIYGVFVVVRHILRRLGKGRTGAILFPGRRKGLLLAMAAAIAVVLGFSGSDIQTSFGHARVVTAVSVQAAIVPAGGRQRFTVTTSPEVEELSLYIEGPELYKTWEADRSSVLGQNQRMWTVEIEIANAGTREMVFAPGHKQWIPTGSRKIKFDVVEMGVLTVECERTMVQSGETQVFEVSTSQECNMLQLYVEGNILYETWEAEEYSLLSDGLRIWNVAVTVNSPGERVFRFAARAGEENFETEKEIRFTVTKAE